MCRCPLRPREWLSVDIVGAAALAVFRPCFAPCTHRPGRTRDVGACLETRFKLTQHPPQLPQLCPHSARVGVAGHLCLTCIASWPCGPFPRLPCLNGLRLLCSSLWCPLLCHALPSYRSIVRLAGFPFPRARARQPAHSIGFWRFCPFAI